DDDVARVLAVPRVVRELARRAPAGARRVVVLASRAAPVHRSTVYPAFVSSAGNPPAPSRCPTPTATTVTPGVSAIFSIAGSHTALRSLIRCDDSTASRTISAGSSPARYAAC